MNNELTPSELIYLFADEFVESGGFLKTKDEHPSGQKIPTKPLCEKMCLGALTYLIENEYLGASTEVKRGIFGSKEVTSFHKNRNWDKDDGIEARILSASEKFNLLTPMIASLLPSECFDPWGEIMRYTKNELVKKGLLTTVSQKSLLIFVSFKYEYASFKKEDFITHLNKVKADLAKYETDKKYVDLRKNISAGIKSKQEHPEGADD